MSADAAATGSTMTASTTGSGPEEDDGPPPLPPGADLAPGYQVVGHIRRGNDLDVYDLWSEERACRCVGKTPRDDRLDKATTTRHLKREGRLLKSFTHPHLVRAYETLTQPRLIVFLETLPGETLSHLIDARERRLPIAQIAHLGLHLCSAMHYLHGQGYLHIDLKPSNIIASAGVAKVLDLSLARRPGRAPRGIGTLGYQAPEQITGQPLTAATDVWGIGAVLYVAATGEDPVDVDSSDEEDRAERVVIAPEPIQRHRRVPTAFRTIIEGCLAADPAARPSIADLTTSLRDIV